MSTSVDAAQPSMNTEQYYMEDGVHKEKRGKRASRADWQVGIVANMLSRCEECVKKKGLAVSYPNKNPEDGRVSVVTSAFVIPSPVHLVPNIFTLEGAEDIHSHSLLAQWADRFSSLLQEISREHNLSFVMRQANVIALSNYVVEIVDTLDNHLQHQRHEVVVQVQIMVDEFFKIKKEWDEGRVIMYNTQMGCFPLSYLSSVNELVENYQRLLEISKNIHEIVRNFLTS
jgi:hypothetical protein